MNIYWKQWKPLADVHQRHDPMHDSSMELVPFLKLFEVWQTEFPGQWKLVTLTGQMFGYGFYAYYSLRLWFGEPDSIRPDYADSMGHNLIAHVASQSRGELANLAHKILEGISFEKTFENGTHVWRLKS